MKYKMDLWTLLKDFIRFGIFTFGGGLSIIAQMQRLYTEERGVCTDDELLDIVSVAKTLPGTMICNAAMLFGSHMAGPRGGLVAVFGMSLPPLVVMIAVSFFYKAFRENFWVVAAMAGAQAAVVPVILAAALGMVKGSIKNTPCLLVTVFCTVLYLAFEVNTIVLVLIGMASGLAMSEYYERRGGLK